MSLFENVKKRCAGNFNMIGKKETSRLVCEEIETLINNRDFDSRQDFKKLIDKEVLNLSEYISNVYENCRISIRDCNKRISDLEKMHKSNVPDKPKPTPKPEFIQCIEKSKKYNKLTYYMCPNCNSAIHDFVHSDGLALDMDCFCHWCKKIKLKDFEKIKLINGVIFHQHGPEPKNPDIKYLDKRNDEIHIHIPEGHSFERVGKLMVSNPVNVFDTEYLDRLTDALPDCFGAKNCCDGSKCIYDKLCEKTSRD